MLGVRVPLCLHMTVTQNYTFRLFIWHNRRQQWLFSTTFTASVSGPLDAMKESFQRNLDFYTRTFPNRVFRVCKGKDFVNSKMPPLCVFDRASYYDFCGKTGEKFPVACNEVYFQIDDEDNVHYILTSIGSPLPGITMIDVIQEILL